MSALQAETPTGAYAPVGVSVEGEKQGRNGTL